MNVYDRIDVRIADQSLTARPIDFVLDENENPIEATTFETTCPACAAAIQFSNVDAIRIDGVTYVVCSQCGAGQKELPIIVPDSIVVASVGQVVETPREVRKLDRGCPFLDPIEFGTFSLATK